jgi:hypothetical protein
LQPRVPVTDDEMRRVNDALGLAPGP